MRRSLVLVLAVTLAATAAGHVAPSVDDNNRYLKITPQADRVRLAYTVFFGEVPGAAVRRTIDADHDGSISDVEAQRFGDEVAANVAAALEVTVDGQTRPVTWKQVSVGMGSPATAAGAFSIDMIVYLCLATARGAHGVLVRDRYRVPKPGETELFVEDGLGIHVVHARIGSATAPANDFKFVGPGGPLSDDGLDLAFTAEATAPLATDGVCTGAPAPAPAGLPKGLVVAAAAVVAFVLALAITLLRRRRAAR